MDINIQRDLARLAGTYCSGSSWGEEYDRHLSMVERPLLFGVFKRKQLLLDGISEGRQPMAQEFIDELCKDLGE